MDMGREYGWNDEIQEDSGEYTLLPEGDYQFVVTEFARERFNGSAKMPACNTAKLTIKIFDNSGQSTLVTHNLFLHSKTEWKLSEFFRAIGRKKKGEKIRMDWTHVLGSTGRCKVIIHTYTDKEGNERKTNRIDKFYPADEQPMPAPNTYTPQAPTQPSPQPNTSWKPGQF